MCIRDSLKAGQIKNFITFSADSDFANPIKQIAKDGKKPIVFSTARETSSELATSARYVFDIQQIRQFICWPKEIFPEVKKKITNL